MEIMSRRSETNLGFLPSSLHGVSFPCPCLPKCKNSAIVTFKNFIHNRKDRLIIQTLLLGCWTKDLDSNSSQMSAKQTEINKRLNFFEASNLVNCKGSVNLLVRNVLNCKDFSSVLVIGNDHWCA